MCPTATGHLRSLARSLSELVSDHHAHPRLQIIVAIYQVTKKEINKSWCYNLTTISFILPQDILAACALVMSTEKMFPQDSQY